MSETLFLYTNFPKWKLSMPSIKDFVEPKIQYGTIIVIAMQFMVGGAWLIADHNNQLEVKANAAKTTEQLETVLQILPVTNKTIEINGSRISSLENEEKQIELRINTLETNYGIAHSDLEELKTAVHDIVQASRLSDRTYNMKEK